MQMEVKQGEKLLNEEKQDKTKVDTDSKNSLDYEHTSHWEIIMFHITSWFDKYFDFNARKTSKLKPPNNQEKPRDKQQRSHFQWENQNNNENGSNRYQAINISNRKEALNN